MVGDLHYSSTRGKQGNEGRGNVRDEIPIFDDGRNCAAHIEGIANSVTAHVCEVEAKAIPNSHRSASRLWLSDKSIAAPYSVFERRASLVSLLSGLHFSLFSRWPFWGRGAAAWQEDNPTSSTRHGKEAIQVQGCNITNM